MYYTRMPIEIESPEMMGYQNVKYNLTESSVFDANINDLNIDIKDLLLCYGNHIGKPELCELIASEHNGISASNILITAGAATALFIANTALLEPNDEIIVMHPNYGTNIETPRAMGCKVVLWSLNIEHNFRPDIELLKTLITSKTKLISITTPHNPTGMQLNHEELNEIIAIADRHNIYVLVDETYRDIPLGNKNTIAASLSENIISVSSLSKAYGLPGIRIGWIVCKNKILMEKFLAAKEQIQICNSVIDEEIAHQFLQQKQKFIIPIANHLQSQFAILKTWLQNQPNISYVLPQGGCVCFPKLNEKINAEKFYEILNAKYGTYVGNGHWFEMDKHYMRVGFGWCSQNELEVGLEAINKTISELLFK